MGSSAYHAELTASCPDGWKVAPLPEVAFFQEGPGILAKDFVDEGVPLIRLKGVEGDFVTLEGCNYLDPHKVAVKWDHFRLDDGDLVISTSASFGRVSEVGEEAEGAVPYTGLIRFRPSSSSLDKSYLRAFLGSAAFMQQVEAMASGSVIRHFGPTHLKQMALHLPPLAEQRAIGEISDLLANRLRLLRKANATLEAIAQALFKSWFVDFDPVRAEAEGREPEGMGAATAAQFPAKMEASEIGLIPEGWQAKPLDSIAKYTNGLALQKYPPESETEFLPVVKIAQLRAGHTVGADRASMNLKPDYVVEDGDVLFSWSGSLLVEQWCGGRGALNQHLFKVTSGEVPKWFYFLATRHHLPHFREVAANKATTMGHIQRRHLAEAFIALPSSTVLEEASKLFTPLLETWLHNAQKARLLQELRDTLLPRLISGKLRLPEAEREVEAATA